MVCLCLLLASQEPESLSAEEFLARIASIRALVGEEAQYDGYVFKGGIRVHVGSATFKVSELGGASPAIVLRGIAEGGKFGYTIRMDIETVLDPETCLPRSCVTNKTGSERRFERYVFQEGSIFYFKKKHCDGQNCSDPSHVVEQTTWFGPIPTGSEIVHCPGCKDLSHYVWRLLHHHKVNRPFLDMISALFTARSCDFRIGSSFVVPVVQSRDRWDVKVTAVEEEAMEVEAGTFNCVKVVLEPTNVGDRKGVEGKFSGLFGIQGSISVWIDRKTRLPVRILGTIPFAFLDLYCEVCLRKIASQPAVRGEAPRSVTRVP